MLILVVFVLNDTNLSKDVLEAWENAGIRGVTILESSGLGRVKKAAMKEDLPLMPSLSDLFKNEETRHRTLFTIVNGEEKVKDVVEAAESVVGDLEGENSGILFSVKVHELYGKNLI